MKAYAKLSQMIRREIFQILLLFLQGQVLLNPSIVSSTLAATFEDKNFPPLVHAEPLFTNNDRVSTDSNKADRVSDILNFWFGVLPNPEFFPIDKLSIWFANSPESDRQIRNYFSQDVINASRGDYNQWRETPRGRLALILLTDQFPRHIYSNRSEGFRLDHMATTLVLEGLQRGDDQSLYPIERAFFYLPLEHSEEIAMQNLAVNSYRQLVAQAPEAIKPQMQDFLQYAILHQQQIARFGRFPHRNAILGRESTAEETLFLTQ